ncbi:MAG TPA: hypothetical protein VGP47_01795 [Parachlamydiaceae bacterium]|nr:hypothetical protein [Parachlamydiaceae bacterium]
MIPLTSFVSTTSVNSMNFNSQVDVSFDEFFGSVCICLPNPVWLTVPTENMQGDIFSLGDYPELFKNKGCQVLCLEVNVRSSLCPDWNKYSPDVLQLKGRFPGCLPIDCFFGKKEGDEIKILSPLKGESFTFLCEQREEPFEDILEKEFMIAYNELNNKYGQGKLSEEEDIRWQIVSRMRKKFYPNSL